MVWQMHHVVSDVTGVTGMKIIRAIVNGQRDPDVLAAMRDVRCKASIATVKAAMLGNYQPEHLFALTQALALYDFYQMRISECDAEIERMLAELNADKQCPAEPLHKPRHKTVQSNAVRFDTRQPLLSTHGRRSDTDSRHRSLPGAALGRRVRDRSEQVANSQALHVVADLGAGMQDPRRQGAVGARAQD